jgi:hypothetical protein
MDKIGAFLAWVEGGGMGDITAASGLLAAVGGILLTLGQMRLVHRQLKLDALIRIMDSNRAIIALGFENPGLWGAMEGKPQTAPAEGSLAQRRYLQLWTNHMQVMWAAQELGLVSDPEWQAYCEDFSEFLRGEALQRHWGHVARFYPEGFRSLVDRLLGRGAGVRGRREPDAK